ncbi:peptide chain release factor N(5)-glutamine methyltransferase [Chitinophagaceae bacterium MMS25-I14]
MPTYNDAFYTVKQQLQPLYDAQEAATIAHELLFHITGLDKLQRLVQKDHPLDTAQEQQLQAGLQQLAAGVPLQYVTGTAWFMGRELTVNKNVLIPRPETEELVDMIITDNAERENISVIDIGTGSGCIPVSLKLSIPTADVSAIDVSADALSVAQNNAARYNAAIQFLQLDFLDETKRAALSSFDIVVSNPPYIPNAYKSDMHTNVKDHEPSLALFVPDEEPLLFYKAIADFGLSHLKENGTIYCELHADHAKQTAEMFADKGYEAVALFNDMHGNVRMLKATRANFV